MSDTRALEEARKHLMWALEDMRYSEECTPSIIDEVNAGIWYLDKFLEENR